MARKSTDANHRFSYQKWPDGQRQRRTTHSYISQSRSRADRDSTERGGGCSAITSRAAGRHVVRGRQGSPLLGALDRWTSLFIFCVIPDRFMFIKHRFRSRSLIRRYAHTPQRSGPLLSRYSPPCNSACVSVRGKRAPPDVGTPPNTLRFRPHQPPLFSPLSSLLAKTSSIYYSHVQFPIYASSRDRH